MKRTFGAHESHRPQYRTDDAYSDSAGSVNPHTASVLILMLIMVACGRLAIVDASR